MVQLNDIAVYRAFEYLAGHEYLLRDCSILS